MIVTLQVYCTGYETQTKRMKGSSNSLDKKTFRPAFHTGKVVMTLMNIICLGKLMCGALSVPPPSLSLS